MVSGELGCSECVQWELINPLNEISFFPIWPCRTYPNRGPLDSSFRICYRPAYFEDDRCSIRDRRESLWRQGAAAPFFQWTSPAPESTS